MSKHSLLDLWEERENEHGDEECSCVEGEPIRPCAWSRFTETNEIDVGSYLDLLLVDSIPDEDEERIAALAIHLDESLPDICVSDYGDDVLEYGNQSYLVVTDSRADELWDASLESYIDDCILPEVGEQYQSYFDRESWKSDERNDGRGHSLSGYDGNEYSETFNGTEYIIFRQN